MPVVLRLIQCILALAVFVSVASYCLLWFEIAPTELGRSIRRSHGGHAWPFLLRGMAMSVMSQFVVLATYPFVLLPARKPAAPSTGAPAILFVHGLYHHRLAWIAWKRYFGRAGYDDLHSLTYLSFGSDFHSIRERVGARLRALRENRPGVPILLVGHSLGGLIIRSLLSDPALAAEVTAAVTLGAPFGGSKAAAFGVGALARSLLYQGELARQVAAVPPAPGVPVLCLYSPTDNMVIPPDALTPPSAPGWLACETSPLGHVDMLYSRECMTTALDFLRGLAPAR